MKRRKFLELSGVAGGALLLGTNANAEAQKSITSTELSKPSGPVTYYIEVRVPGPEKQTVWDKVSALKETLQTTQGYLSLSFKQTIGESTMGRGYPSDATPTLKGVLAEGYASLNGVPAGAPSPKVPYFYVMFVRFANYDDLVASGIEQWFEENIVPSLFAYKVENGAPVKTPIALDYHEGIYTTVGAADRENGYMSQEEIATFLASKQSDEVGNTYVSVNNHFFIKDENQEAFGSLLRENLNGNTRSIFRPIEGDEGYDDTNEDYVLNGQPAKVDNTFFRKALTREILENAFPDNGIRSYLMHGVWETIMDHENSHIDPRFAAGAGKVGSYFTAMPVEPFYITHIQDRFVGQDA